MNKRELKKWLETKEEQALHDVDMVYHKLKDAEKDKILEESGLKAMLEELWESNADWFKRYEQTVDNSRLLRKLSSYSYGMIRALQHLSKGPDMVMKCIKGFINDYDFPEISSIETARQKAKKNVRENYFNVRENIKLSKTAKEATQYLTELGFDVPQNSSSEGEKDTRVSCIVDTRWLFIPKQNQQVESHE